MDRLAIRTEVRALLKEAAAIFWSDATLNRYIGDAMDLYASRTECRTREKTANIVSGQEDYLLPGDLIEPVVVDGVLASTNYYIAVDSKRLQWLVLPTYSLIRGYGTGATLGTTPKFFTYFNGGGASTGHLLNLKLLPTPTASGTNNLLIGYAARVPALSLETDVPQLPSEDHEAVAWQATALAYLQRGQTEEAAIYQTMFDRRIAERLPASFGVKANGSTG